MFGKDFWSILRIILVIAKALLSLENGDLEELDQLSRRQASSTSDHA